MPKKESIVKLTDEERAALIALTKKGTIGAGQLARAHMLRLADEGKQDADIVAALGVGLSTVERTRKKDVEGGLEYALHERPRPGVKPKLDEKQEASLIALAWSPPPHSSVKWTMPLLADRLVHVGIVGEIADETVRRTLKKTCSSPGKSGSGAFRQEEASSSGAWKRSWICLQSPLIPRCHASALTNVPLSCLMTCASRCRLHQDILRARIASMSGKGRVTCSCSWSPISAGDRWK